MTHSATVSDIPTYFALTPAKYVELIDELSKFRSSDINGLINRKLQTVLDFYNVPLKCRGENGRVQAHPNGDWIRAIRQALRRGLSWEISPDDYRGLADKLCDVCGGDTGNGIGLDRLDPSKGYSLDNVRPCCGPCNLKRGSRKAL